VHFRIQIEITQNRNARDVRYITFVTVGRHSEENRLEISNLAEIAPCRQARKPRTIFKSCWRIGPGQRNRD